MAAGVSPGECEVSGRSLKQKWGQRVELPSAAQHRISSPCSIRSRQSRSRRQPPFKGNIKTVVSAVFWYLDVPCFFFSSGGTPFCVDEEKKKKQIPFSFCATFPTKSTLPSEAVRSCDRRRRAKCEAARFVPGAQKHNQRPPFGLPPPGGHRGDKPNALLSRFYFDFNLLYFLLLLLFLKCISAVWASGRTSNAAHAAVLQITP